MRDAKRWFPLDLHATDLLLRTGTRERGFIPRSDIFTTMACYALASRLGGDAIEGPSGSIGYRVVVPNKAELLSLLGYREGRSGFASKSYRVLAASLKRLATIELDWEYTAWTRSGGRGHPSVRSYTAPMIGWSIPLPDEIDPSIHEARFRRWAANYRGQEHWLVLNGYDGIADRRTYFVMVPERFLLLRGRLQDGDARLALWLYRQFRGGRGHSFERQKRVRLSTLRRVLETARSNDDSVHASLERLAACGLLETVIERDDVLELLLGANYFRRKPAGVL
jgi:hypothetical protein